MVSIIQSSIFSKHKNKFFTAHKLIVLSQIKKFSMYIAVKKKEECLLCSNI